MHNYEFKTHAKLTRLKRRSITAHLTMPSALAPAEARVAAAPRLAPRALYQDVAERLREAIFARFVRANWLQLVDNHVDPMHTSYLHTQVQPWTGEQSCDYIRTPWGVMSMQLRKGPRPETSYLRETHYFVPSGLKVCIPAIEKEDFTSPATRRSTGSRARRSPSWGWPSALWWR